MEEIFNKAISMALKLLKKKENLEKVKLKVSRKYKINLKNSEILACIPKSDKHLRKLLILKPTRTLSGVAPVAIMDDSRCPGRCIYCPRGEDGAQSYTGFEPASLRAKQNSFDPFMQVLTRLKQYEEIGHDTGKCELIIMGGTFNSNIFKYQEKFIKKAFDSFNNFEKIKRLFPKKSLFLKTSKGNLKKIIESAQKKKMMQFSKNLKEAHQLNEKSKHRVVGLTIETRPDYAIGKKVKEMVGLGATKVELGVQTLDDKVYEKINRGHSVEDVARAAKDCRNAGLKVCFHMMPGLFSTPKQDVETFKKLFSDERFKPDMLKIYPALVVKGTGLYELWKKGEYKPYNTEQASEVVSEALRYIPEYCRIMRMQRDIPVKYIEDGVKNSNLRQFAYKKAKEKGIKIREIRAREIGELARKNISISKLKNRTSPKKLNPKILSYRASEGEEFFISMENRQGYLLGFLRFRIPFKGIEKSATGRTPTKKNHSAHSALKDDSNGVVRELHVYGTALPLFSKGRGRETFDVQHSGIGKKLLREAEKIAKSKGCGKLYVLSGIGAREYYYKLGFELEEPEGIYIVKKL